MAFTYYFRGLPIEFSDREQAAVEDIVRERLTRQAKKLETEKASWVTKKRAEAAQELAAARESNPENLQEIEAQIVKKLQALDAFATKPVEVEERLWRVNRWGRLPSLRSMTGQAAAAKESVANDEPEAIDGGNASDLAAGYECWLREHFNGQ